VASDLLKPGGYTRLLQYLDNLDCEMQKRGAASLDQLASNKMATIEKAAAEALTNPRYKKSYHPYGLPKVESGLDFFDCVTAPCMEPCAVHQNVPEYAWLISQGKYDQALEVILARNPLPGVTGYVCTHLCQTRCTRNNYEEPVAIRALKRVAVEKGKVKLPLKASTGKKVAVIGSGPSGLAAAAFLALNGVHATIFEAKDKAGGMMRLIPAFRLPDEIIQEDIDRITGLGVEIKTSHPITRSPEDLLKEGYEAVYVASGFQKDMPLDIEGSEGKGVYAALDLLERARRGEKVDLGKKAVVIGGGDTAMDSARVARRFTGEPATILYRRTRHEMPASEEELEGAFEEGTILEELITPMKVILKDGRVVALECLRNRLGEPDASGRRRPVPIEGSEFQVPTDSIIAAIGQKPDLYFLDNSSVSRHKNGSVKADETTGAAGVKRIYAGGDVVEGPESIIAACGDGRRAAEAICAELGVSFSEFSTHPAELTEAEILKVKQSRIRKQTKGIPASLPADQRRGFELIEATLTEDIARMEAQRCVQCATFCDKCTEVCPNRANYTYFVSPVNWSLPKISVQNGALAVTGKETYRVDQTRQIIHVDDFCNECGNCATFCVHNGKPYLEKPRLFFKEEDFLKEQDNAFFIREDGGKWSIQRRDGGKTSRLVWDRQTNQAAFECPELAIELSAENFQVKSMSIKQEFAGEMSLQAAATSLVILKGVLTSAAYLIVA
jgi:putative selenate reductase